MKNRFKQLVLLPFLLSFSLTLLGQVNAGSLDPLFGVNGTAVHNMSTHEDYPRQLEVYPDGRILVAGYYLGPVSGPSGNGFQFCLARFSEDGFPDSTFATNGSITFSAGTPNNDFGTCLKLLPNGEILVGGGGGFDFLPASDFRLAKLDASGMNFVTGFGTNGRASADFQGGHDLANDMEIMADGRIVMVGFSEINFNYSLAALRFLPNGTLDPSFGANGKVLLGTPPQFWEGTGLVLEPDGSMLISGRYIANATSGPFIENAFVLRLDSSGAPDSSFGSNGLALVPMANPFQASAQDIVRTMTGQYLIAGWSTETANSMESFFAARLNSDGSMDSTFGVNGKFIYNVNGSLNFANKVLEQPDGKILVAGGQNISFFAKRSTILRLDSDGTLDSTWGTAGVVQTTFSTVNDEFWDMEILNSGKLLATADALDQNVSQADFALARYETGLPVSAAAPLPAPSPLVVYPNPSESHSVVSIDIVEAGLVSVELFDLNGRRIQEIMPLTWQDVGRFQHSIQRPKGFTSGTYIVRVQTPSGLHASRISFL